MKKSLLLCLGLFVVVGAWVGLTRENHGADKLKQALKTKQKPHLSGIKVHGWTNAVPFERMITNAALLSTFSERICEASVDLKMGAVQQATFYFENGDSVDTRIYIGDNASYLTIPVFEKFWDDPDYYSFPLEAGLAAEFSKVLHDGNVREEAASPKR